ncbi:ADP-dependent glucokinase/phosphofructokinase [Sediminispirochaeta bajacaliforniensis]|uniref:ADP-dependent glucokinase/phosphofructokinase n=1 Tax=Sediminispirochaeta bajacaliforniensis TaxID=148 RepID=UPI000374CE96|nr:ADP-dependent glucokinase/phosphofructokinase [Sediminispirochaeta bajacaliforniensis]
MQQHKIGLGLGNNTDFELAWNPEALEQCIREYDVHEKDLKEERRPILNEKDLLINVLRFIKSEIGGECILEDTETALQFSKRFDYEITIGGTCPRSAIAMRKLGYTSCMHLVTMNEHIKKLLPPDCSYVCSNKDESFDIHLIIQYPADADIIANDIRIHTVRANRIIIDDDYNNSIMNLSEDFFDNCLSQARVFLLSGFNVMQDHELLKKRLSYMKGQLIKLKKQGTTIYYEDACFADETSNRLCKEYLFEHIDIFSLNEDEMKDYLQQDIDLLDASQVAAAAKTLKERFAIPLVVIHSKYWALAYGEHAKDYAACLKGGITMATTRFRFGDSFNEPAQYEETYALPDDEAGKKFADAFASIVGDRGCCIPSVMVEEQNVTTIGLGDAFVGGFIPQLSEM